MDFSLHALGWKAFQDLCATILSDVLGQNVQVFSESRDRGRDAAFEGSWTSTQMGVPGTYTVQCKHTSRHDAHLRLSDLSKEIAKIEHLAASGLADNYLILTNLRLSGNSEAEIRTKLSSIPGMKTVNIFGAEWINQKIAESPRLRALVPRLYGLGDLSQILDERAYSRAQAILTSIGDDLKKLVVTRAQQESARAILDHGFVLLLGDPATGKSTIGAALSIATLDNLGLLTLMPRTPEEFEQHWNPDAPNQFIWVDDAFGTTQYRRDLSDEWNRRFTSMAAAIKRGTRFLFTSRTYIFERAKQDLKLSAFPPLDHSRVIIHVENLTNDEKRQMLYNHIKLGDQPKEFKERIRPILDRVALSPQFLPETARRLGNPMFTKGLAITTESILRFVTHPVEQLLDVISSLDEDSRAGLALIFMNGGALASPILTTTAENAVIQRMGANYRGITRAIESMNGSLTKHVITEGDFSWRFQHPTVGSAIAEYIARNKDLADVYIYGTPIDRLAQEVTCGVVELEGAKLIVPRTLFASFAERLEALPEASIMNFLITRSDRTFCEIVMEREPNLLASLKRHHATIISEPTFALSKKLFAINLLNEEQRSDVALCVHDAVERNLNFSLLQDSAVVNMLTDDEMAAFRAFIADEFVAVVDAHVDAMAEEWERTTDPDDYFDAILTAVDVAEALGLMSRQVASEAESYVYKVSQGLAESYQPKGEPDYDDYGGGGRSLSSGGTDIFSDVAE